MGNESTIDGFVPEIALAGPIPTEIGQLVQLTNLDLNGNELTGACLQIIELIDGKRVYHRQVCASNALAGCTHPGHSPDTVTAPRVLGRCLRVPCVRARGCQQARASSRRSWSPRCPRATCPSELAQYATARQAATTGDHRHPRAWLAVARGSDCGGSRVPEDSSAVA